MNRCLSLLVLMMLLTFSAFAQFKVTGVAETITQGDDGYTAKIKTADNKIYNATISIPNLGEYHGEYRTVKVGETITVEADEDSNYLAVRRLYPGTEEAPRVVGIVVKGVVKKIENGKDGYTAKIVTADKKVYYATISIPNMDENAEQYRDVKIGETIEVTGEYWMLGKEQHITVRGLK